jgi:hypothetical protein
MCFRYDSHCGLESLHQGWSSPIGRFGKLGYKEAIKREKGDPLDNF